MVNINKKYLDSKLEKEIWQEFFNSLKKVHSEKDLKFFLGKYFTPSEITLLEKRLGINYCLKRNLRPCEIQRLLDVSRTTISFVKKELKKTPSQQKARHNLSCSLNSQSSSKKRKAPLLPPRGRGRWSFLRDSRR